MEMKDRHAGPESIEKLRKMDFFLKLMSSFDRLISLPKVFLSQVKLTHPKQSMNPSDRL